MNALYYISGFKLMLNDIFKFDYLEINLKKNVVQYSFKSQNSSRLLSNITYYFK